jgi:ElaB/YqjD/DUF883 family membrane-anchored ribosome-binding protein
MNAKKVLNKIVEFLSANEVELTYAKLADGTIVESKTFDVGEDLFIVSEDGTKTPAPNGMHDLMLKDTEGNETMFKVKTEEGKIVERENVEMADEKVKDIPQAGTYTKDDEVPEVAGEIKSGTLKMEEETDEVMPITEDATKEDEAEIEIELGKKLEEMAYRIEEMEKKMMKMEEAMMPPVDETVTEEVAMEEEELPKLDGAPTEEAMKFSTDSNRKNYGKKVTDSQSNFLSKLYK